MKNCLVFAGYILLTALVQKRTYARIMPYLNNRSFPQKLRLYCKIFLGFAAVTACSAILGTLLLKIIPQGQIFMANMGAAYVFWVAWNVSYPLEGSTKNSLSEGKDTILNSMFFRFIDKSTILYGMSAMFLYVLPYYHTTFELSFFVLLLSVVHICTLCCWGFFGKNAEKFGEKLHKNPISLNITLSLLFVYFALFPLITQY